MSKEPKREYRTEYKGISMKAIAPPGYHFEGYGNKLICDVCNETLGKIDAESLISHQNPYNPKSPLQIQSVINHRQAVETIKKMPMDNLSKAYKYKHEAFAGVMEMSQETSWTSSYDDPNCVKQAHLSVEARNDLTDERLNWSDKKIFTTIPVKYDERTQKAHAFYARKHGFTSVQAYFEDTKNIIEEQKIKRIVTVNPQFKHEKYAARAQKLTAELSKELEAIREYELEADLNERLKEIVKASAAYPDDSNILWIDGSRGGGESTQAEHAARELRREQQEQAQQQEDERLLRSANAKLRSGATLDSLTSDELAAKAYEPPHRNPIGKFIQKLREIKNPPGILLGPDDV